MTYSKCSRKQYFISECVCINVPDSWVVATALVHARGRIWVHVSTLLPFAAAGWRTRRERHSQCVYAHPISSTKRAALNRANVTLSLFASLNLKYSPARVTNIVAHDHRSVVDVELVKNVSNFLMHSSWQVECLLLFAMDWIGLSCRLSRGAQMHFYTLSFALTYIVRKSPTGWENASTPVEKKKSFIHPGDEDVPLSRSLRVTLLQAANRILFLKSVIIWPQC